MYYLYLCLLESIVHRCALGVIISVGQLVRQSDLPLSFSKWCHSVCSLCYSLSLLNITLARTRVVNGIDVLSWHRRISDQASPPLTGRGVLGSIRHVSTAHLPQSALRLFRPYDLHLMDGFHIGQRLSSKGQLCTVRYVGPVTGKSGEWLGVEWDNASRGKHNGTSEGINYFQCRDENLPVLR